MATPNHTLTTLRTVFTVVIITNHPTAQTLLIIHLNLYFIKETTQPNSYKGLFVYKEIPRRKKHTSNNVSLLDNNRFRLHVVHTSYPENDAPLNDSLSFAQATIGQCLVYPSASSVSDIYKEMVNFLVNFKFLMNPLIYLFNNEISSLLDKRNL